MRGGNMTREYNEGVKEGNEERECGKGAKEDI